MAMTIDIVTLFPEYFEQSIRQSMLGRALKEGLVEINLVQLRDFAEDKHRTTDDTPFGGGGGMVLKPEPLDKCLQSLGWNKRPQVKERLVLTSAAGTLFNQDVAVEYSLLDRLTIICGHYLGVDERILELYPIDEVSIGDYILSGGEPAAATIVDAVTRLIPGVLGNFESAMRDSFMDEILGAPVYTRPATYRGLDVPAELLSGHHEQIKQYQRRSGLRKCAANRPDLLHRASLTAREEELVQQWQDENDNISTERKPS